MEKITKNLFKYVLIGVAAFMLTSAVAWAAPADPDSISNNSGKVFEGVFEDNDMLFILESDIAYASEPDEDPEDAFQMLVKNATETELFASRGARRYQWAFNSIYFDADTVTSENLTSGSAYRLVVTGNPAMFPSIVEGTNKATLTLSASDWISTDVLEELEDYLLQIATNMENEETLDLLTTDFEGNPILNSSGIAIFVDAIPGLNNVLSSFFSVSNSQAVFESASANASAEVSSTLATRLGTSLESSFEGIGDFFGISGEATAGLWILLFALTVGSIAFAASGNSGLGVLLAIPVLFLGGYLGAVSMGLIYTGTFLLVAYVTYLVFLRGS